MKGSTMQSRRVGAAAALAAAMPLPAAACAVCYGDPGAPASKGLAWAVVALVLVVAVVLSGVVAFFVHAIRRESRQAGADQGGRTSSTTEERS
ncbi:hypothetical protein [Limisphaera sp. 4302-co]|uniref:hypothetical protein n=1 Tax=Limisphaera sp. 4302-co TaxID=3400417 RepID=UPI003C2724A3